MASVDGEDKKIRLLNVDTPELAKADQSAECLAEEAQQFLNSMLPPGREIQLEYDGEKTDRYGRDLAGVFADGLLMNAEIAREGLGVAVQFGSNAKFFSDVAAAEREAERNHVGVHDPSQECSLPTQVDALTAETATLLALGFSAMAVNDLGTHSSRVSNLLDETARLLRRLDAPSDFANAAYGGYTQERRELNRAITDLERRQADVEKRIDRLEEQAEKERQREEEKRQREAEQLEKERQRELEQRKSPQAPVPQPQAIAPKPAPQPAPAPAPAPAGGYDGYTGCRAYGGNYALTSIDEKGRPYAKINCTTKVQIG